MVAAASVMAQDPPVPAAGSLDTSFSEDGLVVVTRTSFQNGTPQTFTQTADGKMLVGGAHWDSYYLWKVQRLLPDGSPDTAFGDNSIASTPMPGWGSSSSTKLHLLALRDGSIVMAGQSSYDMILVCFRPSGQLDTQFNRTGVLRYSLSPIFPEIISLQEDPYGRVYVLCNVSNNNTGKILPALFRVNSGYVTTVFQDLPAQVKTPGHTEARGAVLAFSPSGDLYIGGSTQSSIANSSPKTPILLRIPDSYNISSIQRLSVTSGAGYVSNLLIDSHGMILVGEVKEDGRSIPGVISRYYGDGTPDRLFGAGGDSVPVSKAVFHMALQTDKKILIAPLDATVLVKRLLPSGAADTGFGHEGSVTPSYGYARNLQLRPEGKILMGSTRFEQGDLIISRLNAGPQPPLSGPEITAQSAPVSRVPIGQPFTFSVTQNSGQPVIYEWRKNGTVVHRSAVTTEPSSTFLASAAAPPVHSSTPEDEYTVVIRDEIGRTTSEPMTLHAIAPPVIHSQIGPEFVIPDRLSIIQIAVDGRAPIQYRLLREGAEIQTGVATNQSSKGVAQILVKDPGNYEVILTNEDGEARSEVFPVLPQKDPYVWITQARLYRVGEAGQLLTYKSLSASYGEVEWRKNGKRVYPSLYWETGISQSDPMTLADAATYTATFRIPKKSYTTPPLEIGVVDQAPQTVYMAAGKKVSFTVAAAGKSLTYAWKKDGEPLTTSPKIPKVTDKILTITKPELSDAGIYVCTVTHPNGQTLDAGGITLIPDFAAPVPLTTVTALTDARLGETYRFDLDTETRTVSYAMTGLPKGLIFDKATGVITGQPMAAGDFKVKITATNLAGSTKFELPLKVHALAHAIAGVYEGMEEGYQGTVTSFKLTVTTSATFSASVRLRDMDGKGTTRSVTGQLTWSAADQRYVFQPEYPDVPYGRAYTYLNFSLNPLATESTDYPLSGFMHTEITGGSFLGIRKALWKAGSPQSAAFSGYYTVTLNVGESGNGYASFTVSPTGGFTFLGKLPDGTALSCGTWLDEQGRFPLSAWIHGSRGRFKGWGIITPDEASSYRDSGVRSYDVAWTRPGSHKALDGHETGSSFVSDFSRGGYFVGTKYLPPNVPNVSSALMLNLPSENNGNVSIRLTGDALTNMVLPGRLTAKHKLLIPPLGKPDESGGVQVTSLVFNPAKGSFTAGVQMHYFDPWTGKHAGTRRFSFTGMVARGADNLRPAAYGFATWSGRFSEYTDEGPSKVYTILRCEGIHVIPSPTP